MKRTILKLLKRLSLKIRKRKNAIELSQDANLFQAILQAFAYGIVFAIFFGFASAVFFVVAIVFLLRLVVLWILAILAPFAFAAAILPGTKGWWDQPVFKSKVSKK